MKGDEPGAEAPIFIAGLDRSGKTTMAALLTSHPNLSIPAVGDNLWRYYYGRYGDLSRPGNLDRCLHAISCYKHVRFLSPDIGRIRSELRSGPVDYGRLFALILRHHAEQAGKPRWGSQAGLVERYADAVLCTHPGARFVHLVRDPRDRYEASLARWPSGRGRAGGAAARWVYSTRLAERNLKRHPGSYLVVRFEDMVRQPTDVLRRVCAHIGEDFDPVMLDMPEAPKHRDRLAEHGGPGSDGTVLSPANIGRYAGRIPAREQAFLELRLGRRMRRYGYEPDGVALGPLGRTRFALQELPSQTGRMVAWRAMEEAQERLPGLVSRRPGRRMLVDPTPSATPAPTQAVAP